MKKINADIVISGQLGLCGGQRVFLGFASSRVLYDHSFADILNDDLGIGYQRRPNRQHSNNFKKYISEPGSSTIPLTFNLRNELAKNWKIVEVSDGKDQLILRSNALSLAQVDCQHRLGSLDSDDIPLAFMTFVGLDLRTEMALFYVINSKARGLSSSLTDYHESNLLSDIVREAPQLYIARKLNEDPNSPWYKQVRYGGETTSGLKRRTSLRMLQKSIMRFLKRSKLSNSLLVDEIYQIILLYWKSVEIVFKNEWDDPRHNLITKGVGMYSLMMFLEDILPSSNMMEISEDYFIEKLNSLKGNIDWSSKGMFSEAGGHKGAMDVYKRIKKAASL